VFTEKTAVRRWSFMRSDLQKKNLQRVEYFKDQFRSKVLTIVARLTSRVMPSVVYFVLNMRVCVIRLFYQWLFCEDRAQNSTCSR
jgi:hypothetical protein